MSARRADTAEEAGVSDQELLRRYREGDAGAFAQVYRRYGRFLYLYAWSMTRDPALSEDLLQRAFLKVLLRDPASIRESVKGLLCASVRNLVRDDLRRAVVERRHFPVLEASKPASPVLPAELETLSWALDRLPPEQREAVVMRIHGDLTFAEIAVILDEPEPTVKSRYRYAIQKLSELLA